MSAVCGRMLGYAMLRVACNRVDIDVLFVFFFFNDTATTEIYTLSLHDALPISTRNTAVSPTATVKRLDVKDCHRPMRSEEHTSELQSPCNLVCRLLLEKKKKHKNRPIARTCGTADLLNANKH